MWALIFVVIAGWLLSLFGQLPLGSMSITATQIRVREGLKPALMYAWGVALVEMVYLRVSLSGIDLIYQHPTIFTAIGWAAVILFFSLGVMSIRSAIIHPPERKNPVLENKINRFVLGASLSAMNPAQIPFWLLWGSYMLEWKVLRPVTFEYNLFTIGAGIGTVTGLLVYIYGGNYIINKLNVSNKSLNITMGIIFFIGSMLQLWRMVVR
ncbi:LysE family transporter [Parasediminibacterium sp. JCM 36343]|uniref:LysE family transporter n=1 Tax=Parasediminibacterium sp. JCM 36343 TaxID=3374279 RepID=UPI00397CC3BC